MNVKGFGWQFYKFFFLSTNLLVSMFLVVFGQQSSTAQRNKIYQALDTQEKVELGIVSIAMV